MSGMQMDPQMLMQLLQGAGGAPGMGGGPGAPPSPAGEAPEASGDWLTGLINDTHDALVQEADPAVVSVLGKIMDLLTTVQAKKAQAGGNA